MSNGLVGFVKNLFKFEIEKNERNKFFSLAGIMFCVLFNYTVLRDMKDALVVQAVGAEVLPYLKGVFVVITSFIMMILYSKMTLVIGSRKSFYVLTSFFLIFFGLFGFVLYPNAHLIHPSKDAIAELCANFPRLKFLISVFSVWSYSLFYVFSECWGSMCLSILFWQFANEVVKSNQAKRFYPIFGMVANLALIFSGEAIQRILIATDKNWKVGLPILTAMILVIGVFQMILHRWVVVSVVRKEEEEGAQLGIVKKKKIKMGLMESVKHLVKSPYLGLIAMLVLCYGMSINYVEILFKKQIGLYYKGDEAGQTMFMAGISKYTGIFVILFILFTKEVFNKLSWLSRALITPVVLFISGILFFVFLLCRDMEFTKTALLYFGTEALWMALLIGSFQSVFSKGCKYSLFDPTKEMAYIPLDDNSKTIGKTAVDGFGGRMSKALGSYTWILLGLIFPGRDIISLTPIMAVILSIVILVWFTSLVSLSKMYHKKLVEAGEGDVDQEQNK